MTSEQSPNGISAADGAPDSGAQRNERDQADTAPEHGSETDPADQARQHRPGAAASDREHGKAADREFR